MDEVTLPEWQGNSCLQFTFHKYSYMLTNTCWRWSMSRIILERNVAARLKNLSEETEVCDEAGIVVGRFFPEKRIKSPYTDAQLDEFEKDLGGRSLAEILRDLEKK